MKRKKLFKTKFNPDIRRISIKNKDCIQYYYDGVLTSEAAQIAADRGAKLMLTTPNKKNVLIWDCSNMIDYEAEARDILQKSLEIHKEYIDSIYVITNSTVIFAAAEIISFFTSYKIKVVKSLKKIKKDLHKKEAVD